MIARTDVKMRIGMEMKAKGLSVMMLMTKEEKKTMRKKTEQISMMSIDLLKL